MLNRPRVGVGTAATRKTRTASQRTPSASCQIAMIQGHKMTPLFCETLNTQDGFELGFLKNPSRSHWQTIEQHSAAHSPCLPRVASVFQLGSVGVEDRSEGSFCLGSFLGLVWPTDEPVVAFRFRRQRHAHYVKPCTSVRFGSVGFGCDVRVDCIPRVVGRWWRRLHVKPGRLAAGVPISKNLRSTNPFIAPSASMYAKQHHIAGYQTVTSDVRHA